MKRGRNYIYFRLSPKYYDYDGYVMEYDFDGHDMTVLNILMVL